MMCVAVLAGCSISPDASPPGNLPALHTELRARGYEKLPEGVHSENGRPVELRYERWEIPSKSHKDEPRVYLTRDANRSWVVDRFDFDVFRCVPTDDSITLGTALDASKEEFAKIPDEE